MVNAIGDLKELMMMIHIKNNGSEESEQDGGVREREPVHPTTYPLVERIACRLRRIGRIETNRVEPGGRSRPLQSLQRRPVVHRIAVKAYDEWDR